MRRYRTVDVFTERRFGGNPLAVVLDAEGLDTAAMQAIAREFNYAETTFVLPPRDAANTAHVRIFTPGKEVPFAGHPNVGTAFVLADAHPGAERFVFEEQAGLVAITLKRDGAMVVGAEITAPEAESCGVEVAAADVARCVGLREADIRTDRHGPVVASVGLPFLFAELVSRDALRRARVILDPFTAVVLPAGSDAIHLYFDAGDRLDARMFSPLDGVGEDPATGSAAGALAALLRTVRGLPVLNLHIRQGEDMGRPSMIEACADGDAVRIGGRCVAVMDGTLRA